MLFRFFFNHLTVKTQVEYLRNRGVILGTRNKNGRKIYTYMINDLFVEIIYKNDDVEDLPETINTLTGLKNLNEHLEKEFKTNF